MRGVLLPSAVPYSLSLTSRIRSSLFSDWRCTVSCKFFDTQVPSMSTEGLVLPRYCRCALPHLYWNGHRLLLNSYLFKIGRTENPSCSADSHSTLELLISFHSVQLRALSTARSLATLFLCELWSRLLGVSRLPPCPIPRKGSGNNNNTQARSNRRAVCTGKPFFKSDSRQKALHFPLWQKMGTFRKLAS